MKQQKQSPADNTDENIQGEDVKVPPVSVDPSEEWKQKYLRALADYQNLEKRAANREEEVRKFAAEVTLRKILPAIDSLTLAVRHLQDEGLRLALKEFAAALESCGVTKMEVVGKPFDPYTMECIEVVSGKDELVVEEVTAGYMFLEKVLRVAGVKVGKKD